MALPKVGQPPANPFQRTSPAPAPKKEAIYIPIDNIKVTPPSEKGQPAKIDIAPGTPVYTRGGSGGRSFVPSGTTGGSDAQTESNRIAEANRQAELAKQQQAEQAKQQALAQQEAQRKQLEQQRMNEVANQRRLEQQGQITQTTKLTTDQKVQVNPYIEKRVVDYVKDSRGNLIPYTQTVYVDPTGMGEQKERVLTGKERAEGKFEVEGGTVSFDTKGDLVASDKGRSRGTKIRNVVEKYSEPTIENLKDFGGNVVAGYQYVDTKLQETITNPIYNKIVESTKGTSFGGDTGLTFEKAKMNIAESYDWMAEKGAKKGATETLKFIGGAGVGILQDVKEKPLKQVAIYGAGAGAGTVLKLGTAGATAINPTLGLVTKGAVVAGGVVGGLGFAGVKGAEVYSTYKTLGITEAGAVTGVTLKDVGIGLAGFKAGSALGTKLVTPKITVKDVGVKDYRKIVGADKSIKAELLQKGRIVEVRKAPINIFGKDVTYKGIYRQDQLGYSKAVKSLKVAGYSTKSAKQAISFRTPRFKPVNPSFSIGKSISTNVKQIGDKTYFKSLSAVNKFQQKNPFKPKLTKTQGNVMTKIEQTYTDKGIKTKFGARYVEQPKSLKTPKNVIDVIGKGEFKPVKAGKFKGETKSFSMETGKIEQGKLIKSRIPQVSKTDTTSIIKVAEPVTKKLPVKGLIEGTTEYKPFEVVKSKSFSRSLTTPKTIKVKGYTTTEGTKVGSYGRESISTRTTKTYSKDSDITILRNLPKQESGFSVPTSKQVTKTVSLGGAEKSILKTTQETAIQSIKGSQSLSTPVIRKAPTISTEAPKTISFPLLTQISSMRTTPTQTATQPIFTTYTAKEQARKQDSALDVISSSATLTATKQGTRQRSAMVQASSTIQASLNSQAQQNLQQTQQASLQGSLLLNLQQSQQARINLTSTIPSFPTNPRTGFPIIKPIIPKETITPPFKLPKAQSYKQPRGLFGVEIRRGGVFRNIGTGSLQKVQAIGQSKTGTTLGATYRIKRLGGSGNLNVPIPKGYYGKKTKSGLEIIEKVGRRLKKGGSEVEEIKMFKSTKSKRRKKWYTKY